MNQHYLGGHERIRLTSQSPADTGKTHGRIFEIRHDRLCRLITNPILVELCRIHWSNFDALIEGPDQTRNPESSESRTDCLVSFYFRPIVEEVPAYI